MEKKTWCRWVTINLMVKNQIYFSCLMCLSWRWHAWYARSHGNSTWCTLCVTRHREGWLDALSHSQQWKHPFQECLHLGSFLKAVLKSCWGMCFNCLLDGSHLTPYSAPYSEAAAQSKENLTYDYFCKSKMAFNILRQCSRALSQSTHFPVELAYLSLYFLYSVKYRFKGEKKQEKQNQTKNPSLYVYVFAHLNTTCNNYK